MQPYPLHKMPQGGGRGGYVSIYMLQGKSEIREIAISLSQTRVKVKCSVKGQFTAGLIKIIKNFRIILIYPKRKDFELHLEETTAKIIHFCPLNSVYLMGLGILGE